jgi:hypothetical protein
MCMSHAMEQHLAQKLKLYNKKISTKTKFGADFFSKEIYIY